MNNICNIYLKLLSRCSSCLMGKDNWSTIPSVFFGNHKPSEYIQEFKNKIRVDKLTKKLKLHLPLL